MSKAIKLIAVLGVTATLVACGAPEEEVIIVPTVPAEPVSGKY